VKTYWIKFRANLNTVSLLRVHAISLSMAVSEFVHRTGKDESAIIEIRIQELKIK
jgi:hypothetical protein